MDLVQQRKTLQRNRVEAIRQETLLRLCKAAGTVLAGQSFYVYSSVLRSGGFREGSDVDIALLAEPPDRSPFRAQAELTEMIGRQVDICLLQ
ncbi:MAG TPA: nucleotidyltransferase domain-containing protein [Chthonomonadales bacterium]|nr:nucleotidyltransferase domain-containing protein [Chthonomonadales bacterium]